MAHEQSKAAEEASRPQRHLPLLMLLFVGSGCSALIYEIVWFQMLGLVIGSSAISLGVLLGTFMGGMCLGSLLLPRWVSPARHPLRVYAVLELGIGLMGIAILLLMPLVDSIYVASVGHGLGSILLRGVVCAVCLLPPTLLMGATLPAIARGVSSDQRGASWLGLFYGGNIAGAVFGSVLAGFYLLRIYDVTIATTVAAAINVSVALLALVLSLLARPQPQDHTHPAEISEPASRAAYLAIAISGMAALGAEVVWTRLLSLMLGATVYTFSIILAVFLVGLGIGSTAGAMLCRKTSARAVLATCQFLLVLAVAWSALMISGSLPYWPISPTLSSSPWYNLQLDVARCLWAILPAAILWGASFPAAIAAVAGRGGDMGKQVGGVYAANTVGAILGALAFSMIIIPHLGTQNAQRLLIALSGLGALVLILPTTLQFRPARLAALLGLIAVALLLSWTVWSTPWELIAYGRSLPESIGKANLIYVGEGMNSSVAVTEEGGARHFHVSGKVEASSSPLDMRLQRMLGHIPALLHERPKSVLVVGCGAGVTAGSFVVHPGVEKITICEIEPLIPQVVARQFKYENYSVLDDRRVQVVYDDARHFVLTTPQRFDIITSDPIHPWVKGAATLYTKEYFEMCKAHLNPGGIAAQWVPLYESNLEAVKSEIRTFFEVFPEGTIWSNDAVGRGYDIVLVGQIDKRRISIDELEARLKQPDYAPVAESLAEVEFGSLIELMGTYAGRAHDLEPWLADAQVNYDRNLRLQYLAGMGLNENQSDLIYDQMMSYCRVSDQVFAASRQQWQALQLEMAKPALKRLKR